MKSLFFPGLSSEKLSEICLTHFTHSNSSPPPHVVSFPISRHHHHLSLLSLPLEAGLYCPLAARGEKTLHPISTQKDFTTNGYINGNAGGTLPKSLTPSHLVGVHSLNL